MENELRDLIKAYQDKAADLIPRLSEALNFKLPITNTDWTGLDIAQRGKTSDGLQYFKHGYGVAIRFDGGEIDIDFGDMGQYDGFDAWRLFRFAVQCNLKTSYRDHREIEAYIKEAESKAQIRYSGYLLYYLGHE